MCTKHVMTKVCNLCNFAATSSCLQTSVFIVSLPLNHPNTLIHNRQLRLLSMTYTLTVHKLYFLYWLEHTFCNTFLLSWR